MITLSMPMWTAYLIAFWIVLYTIRQIIDLFVKFDFLKFYIRYSLRKKNEAKN